MGSDSVTAFVRYKNGPAGILVSVGYNDSHFECEVICAHGSLRFSEYSAKFVKVDKGGKWEDVPFDDLPSPMHHEWKGFVEAIQQDLEPPACGE